MFCVCVCLDQQCLAQEECTIILLKGNLLCRVLVVDQNSISPQAFRVLRTPMSSFISAVYSAELSPDPPFVSA